MVGGIIFQESKEQANLCRDGIGDEYHYFFDCTNETVTELRHKYIPRYYYRNPNVNKIGTLLSLCNVNLLTNISYFVKN